jgi:hydroxymethylglutaryl-CoA lyase
MEMKASKSVFPHSVKIYEVGPRDGLQNEKNIIPTKTKIELINHLSKTGLRSIEVTSFVAPKWIPQLADGADVLQGIEKNPSIHYPVLVPNIQGLERALESKAKEIAVITAASETFSLKNTHCTIEESLSRIQAVMDLAKPQNIPVRAYISCCLGCPYEGEISPEKVAPLAQKLLAMGCYEISLGDTIGVGTPNKAENLIQTLVHSYKIPIHQLAVHFHDTYGQAIANIYACLKLGISVIDSSIAGLGGCPYAKGATGNVATEDVLYLLEGLNIETGVDLQKLIEVTKFVVELTGRPPRSKVAQAILAT